jgi:deoxyribonuclease-2
VKQRRNTPNKFCVRFCRVKKVMTSLLLRLFLAHLLIGLSSAAISCLNEDGVAVGWWVIMKNHGGLDYAYTDATHSSTGPLQLTGRSLDCGTSCALGATLSQLIGASDAARVTWNDEPPVPLPGNSSVASATSGHTKGVIGADADGGFWLTHSMPKFPILANVNSFKWDTSTTYGQSFLCVSLDSANVEVAATGLSFVDPLIYASVIPAGLSALYPKLTSVVAGARSTGSSALTVHSTTLNLFTHYAKSGSWGKDLWEDLIQSDLGVDMYVETWRRAPVMPTYCRPDFPFDTFNVANLQFLDSSGALVGYKYTQDHSKYGIAINATSAQHWLCIGDINRMSSQWVRGGGAVCFRNAVTYNSVAAMIVGVDGCP